MTAELQEVPDVQWAEEPVPLDVFISDSRYLRNPPLSPIQYDAVRHAERIYYPQTYLQLSCSDSSEIREYWSQPVRLVNFLTLEWGKGGGKDHTCRVISMRCAYLLLCLPSPQDYYAMPEQDTIHLLNVASSSKQASRAFFTPMRRAVNRRGGWFQREGTEDLDSSQADVLLDTIRYPKSIEAVSGHSDAESQEGLNIMVGVADEIDAFKRREELAKHNPRAERESTRSAEGIVEMLRSSARTRFPQVFKNVYISYPRYLGSMIQTLRRRAEEDNLVKGLNSAHYVSGPHATWVVNPRVRGKEDFQDDYDEDPVFAAAKYECKPSRAMNPYFSNEAALRACHVQVTQDPLEVAYARDGSAWRPVYTFSPSLIPIRGAQYAMHADLAVNGCRAGIALAHVKRWEDCEVDAPADETGASTTVSERRPVVQVDFVIGYEADKTAQPPLEIQIRWARALCLELRRLGFNIRRFSADGYQSTDTLQILETQYGMETEKVSTDVNDLVWKTLRDVAYEGRLALPVGPITKETPAGPPVSPGERVIWELLSLTRLPNNRIDHPPGGEKDLADAVGGAVNGALKAGGQEDEDGERAWPADGVYVQPRPDTELPYGFELFAKLRPDEIAHHEVMLDGMGRPLAAWDVLDGSEEITNRG